MIEGRSPEWVDLARYSWARDLLLTHGSIRAHALAEAEAARDGRLKGTPDAILNLLLLLCGAEQITADHLAKGGLDLSPVRRALHTKGLVKATFVLEAVAEGLISIRASILEREVGRALESTRQIALHLATAVAQCATFVPIDRSELEQCFLDSRSEIAGRRLKIPSCFRAQDITPTDCFEMARRFAVRAPASTSVLVVGIRTSGSYMAPLVAGWLRAHGFHATYTTVRPKAPLVHIEKRVIRRARADSVLIVDDPPMTGASYVRTARRLEACGIASSAITLLVPVGAEPGLDLGALGSQFNRYPRIELLHRELDVYRQMQSPELQSFIASAAGHPNARVTAVWPPDIVERRARRRHVKQIYHVQGDGRVHVKGVGVGWLGYPARHIVSAMSGRIPESLGFWGSFMATREAPAASQAGHAAEDAATYVAARARTLPVSGHPRANEFQKDGFYRLAKVLARVHGPLAPLKMARLRRELVEALGETSGCLVDGRMGRDEWLSGSPALKRDFEEHAFDKDDLGIYDPAYDLAGALLEFGPSRAAEARAVSQYVALTGDSDVRLRFSTALLLYGAFLMERRWWEVEGEKGTAAWPCAVQDWLESEAAMTWSVNRLLGDAFYLRPPAQVTTLWSIDVDGVLEDAALGFPTPTPAAAAALHRAREGGALLVLNSGRSWRELASRCDALRLDAAVAEYGSAIWVRASGLSQSLLDDRGREALERVRVAARDLSGVHIDTRYMNSVRARRYVGGKLQSLDAEQIATLLDAGSGRVRAVEGVRQTDFVSVECNKGLGLQHLCDHLGFRGSVFGVGDAESDLPVASVATRLYTPRHRDDSLAGATVHLSQDRQRAVLEAVRREHGPFSSKLRPDLPVADSALVRLLAVRDAPRPVRVLRAFGPGLLEVFKT